MCGIAGLLDLKKRPADRGAVERMTKAMAHRGPDATGYFAEDAIAFGHLRLSIMDLSAAANQPFTDKTGRYVMVYNGEIYNHREVRALMKDYDFRTTGDTEVLLAAFAKWGPECLNHMKGMFAFAIWDRQEKELFLARDRMGVKPLYYYQDEGSFLFASEIRGILATDRVKRKRDDAALVEYFSYQSVSYPYSAIEGVRQLEAGSWMKVRNGEVQKKIYWDVTDRAVDAGLSDKTRVHRRIRELMFQSVERRMLSDVPVGAFLSGGIDSSAVVALMAETGSKPNTFNIAFEEKEFDESAYADIVAKKFNTEHTRILLKPAALLDELENALNAMDTPSGDGINTYLVSKAIRRHGMTVALSGIGGDELFAGYPFFDQYLRLRTGKWWWAMPRPLRSLAANAFFGWDAPGPKERIKQLLELPSCGIDQAYPVFRQLLSPRALREFTNLVGEGPVMTAVGRELSLKRQRLSALPLLSQVSAAEYLGYTQHTLLKDTDQMSMAVSLEAREPFFDQDLVEFVLSVPDKMKKPVYPKSLLVESLKPLLPDEIVFRKKQGFLFPWKDWLKNELRSFCDQRIRNIAQRPFIRGQALTSCWSKFLAGDATIRWQELWLFVVLEYWMEKNKVE
jgi:asparagine synthase (glutamine-hydrolysing)